MQNNEEIRNALLSGIHNRLAEISKFMEVQTAILARLYPEDINTLLENCGCLYIRDDDGYGNDCYRLVGDANCTVGFSRDKWLHMVSYDRTGLETAQPLGDWHRTRPINDDGRFLTDSEIEAMKQTETPT